MMADSVCQRVRRHLSGYLDGELARPQRLLVQQHLAGCALCRQSYAGLATVDRQMRSIATPPVPVTLMQQVIAAVTAERTSPATVGSADTPVWPSLWQAALAAAAPLVLGAAATVFYLGWDQASSFVVGYLSRSAAGVAGAGVGLWTRVVSTVTQGPPTLAASVGDGLASRLSSWQLGVSWLEAHYVPALVAAVGIGVLTWKLLQWWGREVRAFAEE